MHNCVFMKKIHNFVPNWIICCENVYDNYHLWGGGEQGWACIGWNGSVFGEKSKPWQRDGETVSKESFRTGDGSIFKKGGKVSIKVLRKFSFAFQNCIKTWSGDCNQVVQGHKGMKVSLVYYIQFCKEKTIFTTKRVKSGYEAAPRPCFITEAIAR